MLNSLFSSWHQATFFRHAHRPHGLRAEAIDKKSGGQQVIMLKKNIKKSAHWAPWLLVLVCHTPC